ncbi:D-alanyl-D-alanine carboxypeptidase family protein [Alkalibaculum sp. M08DMB]|uniref:D-alanyl-D-alanine carboxypeptidase family protein n=1 Tax=Alkalibaculum sporogenes TaxID=2655001 RepID=A0A6A7K4C3_9FIRM|nr:M15 family metallopeptidase [Alkalibaculum sporogenes]MPW24299.1 D-alanyl-D-alanine carboxypeptidase family protein [Alkalibaculum sporogenes]
MKRVIILLAGLILLMLSACQITPHQENDTKKIENNLAAVEDHSSIETPSELIDEKGSKKQDHSSIEAPPELTYEKGPKKQDHSSIETPQKLTDVKIPKKQNQWNLLLANGEFPLPEDFRVPALKQLSTGHMVDSRIYEDLQHMLVDAKAAGVSPIICSAYRSVDRQTTLFNQRVAREIDSGKNEENAVAATAMVIAVPGTSEHHTGLAVDIVDINYQLLNEEQENTPAQKWLMVNSYKYGFILRYPKDKVDITGIVYEPWHYRYVGKDVAKAIFERRITLEEYLDAH